MKRVDRFLVVLVAGVVLLMIVAFVLVRFRTQPAYRAGSEPADVAHNYLFALQQEDFERAYGYLSPEIANYPRNVTRFEFQVRNNGYTFGFDNTSLTVGDARISGNRATVPVRQRISYGGGGLAGTDGYDNDFEIQLERGGADQPWLIVNSGQFWAYCWGQLGTSC